MIATESIYPDGELLCNSRLGSHNLVPEAIQSVHKRSTKSEYILRHFITGKTLSVFQDEDGQLNPELSDQSCHSLELVLAKEGVNEFI